MLFKIASFVLSFIFLTSVLTFSLQAQLISSEIYETEEDLQEGLELGLLTFDDYLELLDLIQAKVMPTSEEADKLFFVPDVSPGDISQIRSKEKKDILLNQKTEPFLSESQKRKLGLTAQYSMLKFNDLGADCFRFVSKAIGFLSSPKSGGCV